MATTTGPRGKKTRRGWRIVRWAFGAVLPVVGGLAVFTLLRPLTVLQAAIQARLWFSGIHSEWTEIPFAGSQHVRVHYFVGGSGEPLLLVHGLGGRAEDWANLMPKLVGGHHRVYALSLPGYGRSDWPANATYSIGEETQAVEAFMNRMHLGRTDLAGWSMGGWIAMQVALNRPQQIRRLIILDSAGIRFRFSWNPNLFEPDTPAKLRQLNRLLAPGLPEYVPGFIQRAIFRYVKRHGWVVRRNMQSMLTGRALLDNRLGGLSMPMLIVWGKQDHLIPPSVGERIHREVPNSELALFDGCGHLAASQCAGPIAPVIRGFLDEPNPMAGRSAAIGP